MANQFSDRPPFCEFIEGYLNTNKHKWKHSTLLSKRVDCGRFDEWLQVCPYKLEELDWKRFMDFHEHLISEGYPPRACQKAILTAKHIIRWHIERGKLPQEISSLYVSNYIQHTWDIKLPKLSEEFLFSMEATRPGSHRHHKYVQRIFHTFLKEKKLTYRKLRQKDLVNFIKYQKDHGLQLQTRMTTTRATKAYLKWLHNKKKISRQAEELIPAHMVPKKERNLPRPLEPDVDFKMQEVLKNTYDIYYKSILLIRRTGMRISELRLLEFDCIQTDSKGRRSLKVPAIKLGIQRLVPLDNETCDLVKLIQEMSLKHFNSTKRKPDRLVVSELSTYPRYEKFSEAMSEICVNLKVEKWINLHALRHTYATSMLNAGLSIISLKEILGHKTINMSLLYAKVTQEKVHKEYNDALKKMNSDQIPNILSKKPSLSQAFKEINDGIKKKLDSTSVDKIKKLKSIQNRLAKIKMELGKI